MSYLAEQRVLRLKEALTRNVQQHGLFMVDDISFNASTDQNNPRLLTDADTPLPQDE
jgi:hypothetical protein